MTTEDNHRSIMEISMKSTPLSGETTRIHPDLRIEATFAKATGALLMGAGLAFFAFAVLLLGVSTGSLREALAFDSSISLTGWMVVGTCFLVALFLVYCGRHLRVEHLGRLRRVSWLLQNSQPVVMHLIPDWSEDSSSKRASLFFEGRRDFTVPDDLVDIRSPGWRISGVREEMVQVYRESDPEGIVVMVTSNGVLWGQRANVTLSSPAQGHP